MPSIELSLVLKMEQVNPLPVHVQIMVHVIWGLHGRKGVQDNLVFGGLRGALLDVTTVWLTPGTLITMGVYPLPLSLVILLMQTRQGSGSLIATILKHRMSCQKSFGQWTFMLFHMQKMIVIVVSINFVAQLFCKFVCSLLTFPKIWKSYLLPSP